MVDVLVLAEHTEAALRGSTRELLTLARSLGTPSVVWVGDLPESAVSELGQFGGQCVLHVANPEVAQFGAPALAEALQTAMADAGVVLLASTFENKDVAARLAVLTGSGAIVDASAVAAEAGGFVATVSAFTGAYLMRTTVTHGVPIIAVKPNAITAAPAQEPTQPRVVELPVTLSPAARTAQVLERTPRPSTGRPDLSEAAVVVVGGRGMNGDFGPVERLADRLGGAIGSTRVAVDEGWVDHTTQIGQTGVTITPKLYIGAGVSGAIHHRSGMQGSQTIVAINTDPDAPIFEIADFGIVGDAATVLDQTTQALGG